ALDTYEGTLIKLTGTVNADFSSAGAQHVAAVAATTGLPSENKLKLRLPTALRDGLDAVKTCGFTIDRVPLWRNNAQREPSAWRKADITLTGCPAPQVVKAVPTSATTVLVTFDRNIKPSSLDASGAQFTFDNGLGASAATVSGRVVTVTTSAQAAGTSYA